MSTRIAHIAVFIGSVRVNRHANKVAHWVGDTLKKRVQQVFSNGGELIDASYTSRLEKMLGEFEWYVDALAIAREKGVPY